MNYIKGICIKSYRDEDDIYDFEDGKIEECDIRVYLVGEVDNIVENQYNGEYWKAFDS